jgi:hypothetical protein
MELSEIKEVVEINHPKRTNKYLKLGWILINTYTVCPDSDGHQTMRYVLGWPKAEKAVHPEPDYKIY